MEVVSAKQTAAVVTVLISAVIAGAILSIPTCAVYDAAHESHRDYPVLEAVHYISCGISGHVGAAISSMTG